MPTSNHPMGFTAYEQPVPSSPSETPSLSLPFHPFVAGSIIAARFWRILFRNRVDPGAESS